MRIGTVISNGEMARLNISLPDDLYRQATKWRHRINLSEICARALRGELEAAELHRSAHGLFPAIRPASPLERTLASRYGLVEAVATDPAPYAEALREELGTTAAAYLDRYLSDGSLVAIGGGRQMWCLVRNLTPRQLRLTITGLGVHPNDPYVLHAHANTLTTLLWLLYSPRAKARLVGDDLDSIWKPDLPRKKYPQYFVVGSCSPFTATSPLARLLGRKATQQLLSKGVSGDFLYHFFSEDGQLLPSPRLETRSVLSARLLQALSTRADARVIVVAGGDEKLKALTFVLRLRLCNVLITDSVTARKLLEHT